MARLTKGEIAPGIAARKRRAGDSVRSIVTIVRKLADESMERTPYLQQKLKSYRSLAEWNEPSMAIVPVSENTLRKYVSREHPRGLRGFEQDRQRALGSSLEKSAHPKEDYQALVNYLAEYNERYMDLLVRVLHLRGSDRRLKQACDAHLSKFPLDDVREKPSRDGD